MRGSINLTFLILIILSLKNYAENLTGKVTDAVSGTPISGAVITIVQLSSSTLTNANGNYAFGNIPDATYTVSAAKTGYITQQKQITVGAGPVLSIDITDKLDFGEVPLGKTKDMTFSITNTGSGILTGTITSNNNWITVTPEKFEGDIIVNVTVDNDILNQREGQHSGSISIISNGGNAEIEVVLTATCVLVKPNPYISGSGNIRFFGSGIVPETTTIKIYSISGELITVLKSQGTQEVLWDGNDSSGRKVGPGIYLYTYESPVEKGISKFTVR